MMISIKKTPKGRPETGIQRSTHSDSRKMTGKVRGRI
jgi:hypothetical protein